MTDQNTWTEWSKHVLLELERLDRCLAEVKKIQNEVKIALATGENDLNKIDARLIIIEANVQKCLADIKKLQQDIQVCTALSDKDLETLGQRILDLETKCKTLEEAYNKAETDLTQLKVKSGFWGMCGAIGTILVFILLHFILKHI